MRRFRLSALQFVAMAAFSALALSPTVKADASSQPTTQYDVVLTPDELETAKGESDSCFKRQDYAGAIESLDKAIKSELGWADPGVYYRIAVSASRSGRYNQGLAALRRLNELRPDSHDDPEIRGIRSRLITGNADTAATITAVTSMLTRLNETVPEEERVRLIKNVEAELRPYLNDPWQENVELWRLGGMLAIRSNDQWLAATCLVKLQTLSANEDDPREFSGIVTLLTQLAGDSVDSAVSRSHHAWTILLPYYARPDHHGAGISAKAFSHPETLRELEKVKLTIALEQPGFVFPDLSKSLAFSNTIFESERVSRFADKGMRKELISAYAGALQSLLFYWKPYDEENTTLDLALNRLAELKSVEAEKPINLCLYLEKLHVAYLLTNGGNYVISFPIRARDINEAERLLLEAAEIKMATSPTLAWISLGHIYKENSEHPNPKANRRLSFKYFLIAGQSPHEHSLDAISAEALVYAAICVTKSGDGLNRNLFLAAHLLKQAAAQGDSNAADCLRVGNFGQALKWDEW